MEDKYFYAVGEKRSGPTSLTDLKGMAINGQLKRSDMIWKAGMAAWQNAGCCNEIFAGLPPDLPSTHQPSPSGETISSTDPLSSEEVGCFFYAQNGNRFGPVTLSKVRELALRGELKRTDLVWRPGMGDWQKAGEMAKIFAGLPPDLSKKGADIEPPPLPDLSAIPEFVEVKKFRSPGLMALASFLLPGLGQIICGQDAKGIYLIIVSVVGNLFSLGLSSLWLCPMAAFDAYTIVQKQNERNPVRRWEFLPSLPTLNAAAHPHMPFLILLFVALSIALRYAL